MGMDGREGSVTSSCECASATMSSNSSTPASKGKLYFSDIPFCCFLREFISNEIDAFSCSKSSRRCLAESYRRFSLIFWKIFHSILLDKRMFVLLILLNPLLTESSPAHRVRHRHLRHTLRNDRLCDKPQVMDHPHDRECRHFRVRRDIHHMNLREGENSTMCDYRVCVDRNPNRMPQEIHRVFCVESGCRCQEEGSFRCTQLTDKVEVWYGVSQGQPRVDRVEVEVGCVCAAKHGFHVDNFNPSYSVDK